MSKPIGKPEDWQRVFDRMSDHQLEVEREQYMRLANKRPEWNRVLNQLLLSIDERKEQN